MFHKCPSLDLQNKIVKKITDTTFKYDFFTLLFQCQPPKNGQTHSNNSSVFDNFVGLELKGLNNIQVLIV